MRPIEHLSFFLAIALLAAGALAGCGESAPKGPPFAGEPADVELAEAMFEAIGGRVRWAEMRSLYIKATHRQPDLNKPYQSEIWRSLDSFKLRIEQQNEDFHRIGLFSDEAGWIRYVNGDSAYQLKPLQLQSWRYSQEQNVYVLLHRLAGESGFRVHVKDERTVQFFEGPQWVCSFELDEENRPTRFIRPNVEGDNVVSQFTAWGESNGYTHPIAGGPSDGSFVFNTELWAPSDKSFEQAFNVPYRYEPAAGSQ